MANTRPLRPRARGRPHRRGARAHTTLLAWIAVGSAPVAAQATTAADYAVDPARSVVYAVTHRAGLLGFLGHEHAVVPRAWSARICAGTPLGPEARGSVTLRADSLTIDSDSARALAHLGDGPGPDDVRTIRGRMGDPDHLDVARYPTIRLSIDSLTASSPDSATARGVLTLHGVERPVAVRILVDGPDRGVLSVSGALRIRQSDFGIDPESVAGVVKVADEVDVVFRLVALATGEECSEPSP